MTLDCPYCGAKVPEGKLFAHVDECPGMSGYGNSSMPDGENTGASYGRSAKKPSLDNYDRSER